jgi:hypothetical protein
MARNRIGRQLATLDRSDASYGDQVADIFRGELRRRRQLRRARTAGHAARGFGWGIFASAFIALVFLSNAGAIRAEFVGR